MKQPDSSIHSATGSSLNHFYELFDNRCLKKFKTESKQLRKSRRELIGAEDILQIHNVKKEFYVNFVRILQKNSA